jgi:hypothetical protein
LGIQILICRIGLDESGDIPPKRLEKVASNVLVVAESVVDFLDTLTEVEYGAFWAPCKSEDSVLTDD